MMIIIIIIIIIINHSLKQDLILKTVQSTESCLKESF